MVAIDFPANPTVGQPFFGAGILYVWNGQGWKVEGGAASYTKAESDLLFVNAAGDTMTGPLVLPADPTLPLEAVTKQYADQISTGGTTAFVNVTGDIMTGHLDLPVGPLPSQAVRRDYVDAADSGKANNSVVFTAGAGLVGGGSLLVNRTFDVGAGAGINVAADAVALVIPVAPIHGGTGLISYVTGDLLIGLTATSLARLPDIAVGNALLSGGAGVAPFYGKVGLTTHVDGVLPIANGGTGSATGISGATQAALDGKVAKAGDTMTCPLSLQAASPTINLYKNAGGNAKLLSLNGGLPRWLLYFGDSTPESGANAGSDIQLYKYNDAGDTPTQALNINRATGLMTLAGNPTVPLGAATKQYVDNAVTGGISYTKAESDTKFVDAAGDSMTGTLTIIPPSGNASMQLVSSIGTNKDFYGRVSTLATGLRWLIRPGNAVVESGGNAGSDFNIISFNDTGGVLDTPVTINRASGLITIKGDPTAPLGVATKQYVDQVSTGGTAAFVNVTGDTMTGDLVIEKAFPLLQLKKTTAVSAAVQGLNGNSLRWHMSLGNGVGEGGGNTGSNFNLIRYNDAGAQLGVPLDINRATGLMTLEGDPTAALGAATKQYVDAASLAVMADENLIVNGSMEIAQEFPVGTSTAWTGPANKTVHAIDQWMSGGSQSGTLTLSFAQVDAWGQGLPGYFRAFQWTNSGTTPASIPASDFLVMQQIIEQSRISKMLWGGAAALPLQIGFWFRTGLPGTVLNLTLRNGALDRSYVTEFTIVGGNTWEYKSFTIPGPTSGNFQGNLYVTISLETGSSYRTASINSWITGSFFGSPAASNPFNAAGNYFQIAGFFALPGSKMPTAAQAQLVMRSVERELVLCQRYFQRYTSLIIDGNGTAAAANYYSSYTWLPMRAIPTVSFDTIGYNNASALAVNTTAISNVMVVANSTAGGASHAVFAMSVNARL